jgi:hypothetical protein
MNNTLLPANIKADVLQQLNTTVSTILTEKDLNGFQKAYAIAEATAKLKTALTPDYMKPIMQLQGHRLGFKTDLDHENKFYPESVVKNCLIEAVLTGVECFGNQFNIIAGNCYITKEGFGHLLAKFPGLQYEIIPQLPRIKEDKSSAAIVMKITWTLAGKTETRDIDFPIRMNARMGVDAVIGKATRKARAWLFNNITGMEIGDGDVTDIDSTVVSSKVNEPTIEELKKVLEEKRALLTPAELAAANRIIDGNETNSFAKLFRDLSNK